MYSTTLNIRNYLIRSSFTTLPPKIQPNVLNQPTNNKTKSTVKPYEIAEPEKIDSSIKKSKCPKEKEEPYSWPFLL